MLNTRLVDVDIYMHAAGRVIMLRLLSKYDDYIVGTLNIHLQLTYKYNNWHIEECWSTNKYNNKSYYH